MNPWPKVAAAVMTGAVGAVLLAVPLVQPWLLQATLEHDASRLLQVLLLAGCGLACLPWAARAGRWPLLALLALGVALLSIAMAAQPGWALRELAVFSGLGALAWVVARQVSPAALHWAVAGSAALYAAVVLLLGALVYAAGTGVTREEIFLGFANRRFFNHVQTVAVPLCAIVGVVGASRVLRGLAWTAVALQTSLLILCAGRATALALVVGAAVALVLTGRHAMRLWRPSLLAVVAGVAVYLLVFQALPAQVGSALPANADLALQRLGDDQARGQLWRQAADAALAHPWLGVGPMHLAHAAAFNGTAAHPHNLWLQLAAEWGLPFTLALVWLAWTRGRLLWLRARNVPSPEHAGLLMVAVAIVVDACFSGNLVMPVSQIWAAVAVGWMWRVSVSEGQPPGPPRSSSRAALVASRMATIGLLVVLPLWLAAVVALEWKHRAAQHAATMQAFAAPRMHPRFWTHGWFPAPPVVPEQPVPLESARIPEHP